MSSPVGTDGMRTSISYRDPTALRNGRRCLDSVQLEEGEAAARERLAASLRGEHAVVGTLELDEPLAEGNQGVVFQEALDEGTGEVLVEMNLGSPVSGIRAGAGLCRAARDRGLGAGPAAGDHAAAH